VIDSFARIAFLKRIHLFHGLGDEEFAMVAEQLEEQAYTSGEVIYRQNQNADNFYLIYKGGVKIVTLQKGKEINPSTLVTNDYFGHLDLLERRSRTGTATAQSDTLLLALPRAKFYQLRKTSPDFKSNLDIAIQTRQLARTLRFRWLAPNEVIYFLARKHPIILIRNLILPFLVLFVPAIFLYWWVASVHSFLLLFAAGASLVVDILWAIWLIVDWGNDYYIVTNQRVVWLERVVAVYDSRQESPLNTILAVAVETSLLGRWFDFGDVIVRTFVSKIIFRYVSHPKQAQRMIEEYWKRTKDQAVGVEKEAMKDAIRKKLGIQMKPPASAAPAKKADFPPPRGLAKIFGPLSTDRLRLRYEQGDTVVYRKHWFVLIRKAWIPILGLLTFLGILIYRLYLIATTSATLFSGANGTTPDAWAGAFVALFFVMVLWFIYDFVDWSNDRFEVNNEQIIDVYKKPLSTESRNASQLENILGTEYMRVGVLGQMFNYGDVFITVGGTKLTFEDVIDPATVQSDIDRRRMAQKARKEEKDRAAKRDEMADWLAIYHQNAEKFRQEENDQRKKSE
jgi:CRP-like cAMP-binding protein/uncharacterized membrane protein YdbT with pleckstrin-like domain